MNGLRWIGIGCMLVGMGLVMISADACWRRYALFGHLVTTWGTIARAEHADAFYTTGGGQMDAPIPHRYTVYDLIVRYRDEADAVRECRFHGASYGHVGDSVELIYEAGNPTNVIATGDGYQGVIWNLLASLSLVGLGGALYALSGWFKHPAEHVSDVSDRVPAGPP